MVEVKHVYSKDHRPDLKQVMMGLTMSGPANLPIWMEPLNGNSSDKTSLHETIGHVRAFQRQLAACDELFWIADSALYTP
jgi:transposase